MKIKKHFNKFKKFLANPETHAKVKRGVRTVASVSHEWSEGIGETIGVPETANKRHNALVGMKDGILETLPKTPGLIHPHHKHNLGRIVVRRPGHVREFW